MSTSPAMPNRIAFRPLLGACEPVVILAELLDGRIGFGGLSLLPAGHPQTTNPSIPPFYSGRLSLEIRVASWLGELTTNVQETGRGGAAALHSSRRATDGSSFAARRAGR